MSLDPFRIRDHVAGFDAIVGDLLARSAATRQRVRFLAGVSYGEAPTETLDIFFPPEPRADALPVHIFIHGGYWRMFSKEDYSCVADTVTAAGAIAVIVDYALMPSVRMDTIVDQVRRAKVWVTGHIAEHGGDPGRLTISGHSAGAHLATFLFNEGGGSSGVKAALLLGGLYDLAPLQSSFLQAEIGLTDAEVASFTPLGHRHDPSTAAAVLVGADETPPFHAQADAFAALLREQGLSVTRRAIAGRNHMDSVRDLGLPDSEAGTALASLIEAA
ncbi:arylformamidase [Pseudoxanthobacter soli DSM 19599]|uniref:Arylformamidase n=1 Tax=Pseudoxanthobacter soli DSM 19599 TaxID=1123029 RepID=A0A1M7ZNK2_9HYPH|nr:alpha/beta hydrolase [Pseudoxanthobacter soli]SHO66478.1 arylformamidase [Pseudoxanthobacter soli DSM 19599]